MSTEEIQCKLHSTKSAERRRAAKEIGKLKIHELADELYSAYLNELNDKRTWETQVEMILALGQLNYKNAINDINKIVKANAPHDMITYAAAQTYVRLQRQSLEDASPILELLAFGGLSIVDGCLNPLGYDIMQPPAYQIKELITLTWNLHKHKDYESGYGDPRYGIAAACAGWDKNLTQHFLEHCIETADGYTPLIYVSENSLKGKYVTLR
ncbi:MAG: hypothetical protein IPI46_11040 [Bacteroidetes bacterium]|nr:hypothetical protein [Bacteroidota bacterium]